MNIKVVKADYLSQEHAKEIPMLLNEYASDPMGGGQPLNENVKNNLVKALSKLPHAFSVIAYVDGQPAGLANCFEAFSTFSCKPLINIHDFVVLNEYRGNGISQILLDEIEKFAKSKGCCKVTLEVLSNNKAAKAAYSKFGFSGYELDPKAGVALFWQKKLLNT
jgi:ribosomal protein S18 acetylase RimI-like enzyme